MTKSPGVQIVKEIISLCLNMDELSLEIYGNFSQSAGNEDLKAFWDEMVGEEKQHVEFWRVLLSLAQEGVIPQIFEDPAGTRDGLKENFAKIVELKKKSPAAKSLTENFILAFRLEFYLLHPALEQLWRFYDIIQNAQTNPGRAYDKHLRHFIEAMRKFGPASMELEVLGETIERMWFYSKDMAWEAYSDELTGILNRRGIFSAMISLACLAKRNKFLSAVLMIDIDRFKQVNDSFGHQAGDAVIKEISQIIKENIRASDIAGRLGGDEFLVFLPQVEETGLRFITDKILDAVRQKPGVPVTVSIGGAKRIFHGPVENEIHELIKQADKFLYHAKGGGRNHAVL